MKLNTKITLFFVIISSLVLLVLVTVNLFTVRNLSLNMAASQARIAAEIVKVHLTESMVAGTINKRERFLARLDAVDGLLQTRVIRGPAVVEQFGPGLFQEQGADEVERKVLQTGVPSYAVTDGDDAIFRAVIPYPATAGGDPVCTDCHKVARGTILGAISMTISLAEQRSRALLSIAVLSGVVLVFSLLSILFSRRLIRPLVRTAEQVQNAVDKGCVGDYNSQIVQKTDDEVGQIASSINKLMSVLKDGLGQISSRVANLIDYPLQGNSNQLNATIEIVDALTEVSRFKQAIEEDETKEEVYQRLSRVICDHFLVHQFSVYEITAGKNQMRPMVVDGMPLGECRWCDERILERADGCRAKRTGRIVDGVGSPGICTAFHRPEGHADSCHICLPVMQSGSVGSVVQLVVARTQAKLMQQMLPFLQIYLREAGPVLEAKRLMYTLKESTLIDPMTGLHNRRFLQEIVDSLVSYSLRNEKKFAVMMADVDYFKQVNDNYGHEAGDLMLKAVAKVLKQSVRASDLVIRYGGEEFLLLLRDTDAEQACEIGEKIRKAMQDTKVQVSGAILQKTISLGVSGFPDDSETFWQVVKYADVALYKAKEGGRNQVLRFDTGMWGDDKQY